MARYRKIPVVVEAMQFTNENKDIVFNWISCNRYADFEEPGAFDKPVLKIQTLEGDMTAKLGDYIIKGVNGEFYPCKPDIFQKTYEPAEQPEKMDVNKAIADVVVKQWLLEGICRHLQEN